MSYNYHCNNHLNENIEHRNCNICNNKGDLISEDKKEIICPNSTDSCPSVKRILKLIGENFNGCIGMNKKEMQKSLQLRSKKHYKKEIKERENQMHNDTFKSIMKT